MGVAKGEGDSVAELCPLLPIMLNLHWRPESIPRIYVLCLPINLQSLAKHSRNNIGAEGGPPPFVPFGQVRNI